MILLVFDVRVQNQCGGERRVSILYDSIGRASAVELYAPGATTSTTVTTTTTVAGNTTTTATLPPTCLETATGRTVSRVTYVFAGPGVERSPGEPATLAKAAIERFNAS